MRKLVIVFALLCLVPFTALAQDEEPVLLEDCTPDEIEEINEELEDLKSDLLDAVEDGDAEEVAVLSTELADLSDQIRRLCIAPAKTISFDSEELGEDAGFGPVEIGEGTYRITTETGGAFSVDYLPLEGECSTPTYTSGLFYLSAGIGGDGAEQMFVSEGCTIALQIDGDAPWVMTFELLEAEAEAISFPFTVTNEETSQQALIGPFEFESGEYKVSATTAQDITLNYVAVDGTCNESDYSTSIISTYSGRAAEVASGLFTSDDCVAFLEVKGASEDWEVTIEELAEPIVFEDKLTFSSEDEGLYSVIGPLALPEGDYTITATTVGYLIMDYTLLRGTCVGEDAYYTSLFNLGSGEGDSGATTTLNSQECELVFEMSNAGDPWEVTIASAE